MPAAYPREFREDVVRKDAFCGWIVGYSMDSRMKARLAVKHWSMRPRGAGIFLRVAVEERPRSPSLADP